MCTGRFKVMAEIKNLFEIAVLSDPQAPLINLNGDIKIA